MTETDQTAVVPILEETVEVEKRAVETGRARVHVTVAHHHETIQTLLHSQDVSIDRVPIDREVETAPPTRTEGDTVIIPVMEEVAVVVKRLVLKEELHIRIKKTEHVDTQVVHLRREQADIRHTEDGVPQPETERTTS